MPERERRPDLDERFSLHPADGEDVLRRLLGAGATHEDGEDEDRMPEGDSP